jgi:hypothetical protein
MRITLHPSARRFPQDGAVVLDSSYLVSEHCVHCSEKYILLSISTAKVLPSQKQFKKVIFPGMFAHSDEVRTNPKIFVSHFTSSQVICETILQ